MKTVKQYFEDSVLDFSFLSRIFFKLYDMIKVFITNDGLQLIMSKLKWEFC